MTEPTTVHHQTRRGADLALAKRLISRASYDAVLAGTLTLAEAKSLGRDRGPDTTQASGGPESATGRASAGSPDAATDAPPKPRRICICGCGEVVRGKKSRFRPGHDARLHSELKRNLEKDPLLRNERFTEEQRAYAVERELIAE